MKSTITVTLDIEHDRSLFKEGSITILGGEVKHLAEEAAEALQARLSSRDKGVPHCAFATSGAVVRVRVRFPSAYGVVEQKAPVKPVTLVLTTKEEQDAVWNALVNRGSIMRPFLDAINPPDRS